MMENGQNKFLAFIDAAVEPTNQDRVHDILQKSFQAQQAGTFDYKAFLNMKDDLLVLVKPDQKIKVEAAMNQFADQLKKG
ncbi:hypothetical protein [Secundilactobacillus paracollinoides]|uniref:hypothetical protein n=1 Tax=Secundilactobacillus paracollinoides TaxID=240427 RepID=UPI0006EEBF38|nr:hypothetical protein [Secundilactobacillus paracollinoides]KRL78858.1 hypothetical protein FC17_GL000875 [Secundilactobacillus paracollinoides DSM 15502 = JCM 11969]